MSHTVTLNYINKNYALENAKQMLNKINALITKFKDYFGLQYLLKQQAKINLYNAAEQITSYTINLIVLDAYYDLDRKEN